VLSAIDATPATALVMHTRIENSARAGVSNFGGDVGLEGVQLECNTIALASEVLPIIERPSTFDDRGNNLCGCGEIVSECKAISSGLEPPEPL